MNKQDEFNEENAGNKKVTRMSKHGEHSSLRDSVMASIKSNNRQLDEKKISENRAHLKQHAEEEQQTDESQKDEYFDSPIDKNASEELIKGKEWEILQKRERRKKETSTVNKIVTAVISALVIVGIIVGVSAYRFWQSGLEPLNPKDDKLVQVNIPIGTSNKGIGGILEKDNIIKSGLVFNYYMKAENHTDFKGGYYQMSPDMTLDEIAELLKQGGTEEPTALADARISIPEGYSVEQIADLIGEKTKISKKDFLAAVKDENLLNELYNTYPETLKSSKESGEVRYHLEGYLFPATYNYYEEKTASDLIKEMVAKANAELNARKDVINQSGMSIQQVLTLASLVEKEGVEQGDRRDIARVFMNRIEQKMPLQSDISILYAMNKHKVHLSIKDTQVESPYNLYQNTGYGPGPFNNPGLEAIDAVLYPADNEYLYFLANVETHKVYFAKTYEEHLKYKEEHIDNLDN